MRRWTFPYRYTGLTSVTQLTDDAYAHIMSHAPAEFTDHDVVLAAANAAIGDIICGCCDARGWSPRACVRNRAMDLLYEWHTGVQAHERKTRRVSA